jgi:hypothetical protein
MIEHYKDYNISFCGPIGNFREDLISYDGPFNGTCYQRNVITKLFNDKLSELCGKNNTPFITVFYDMIDENLLTKIEYTDGNIHLNQNVITLIIDKFKNNKLL